jgi:ribosomal protein S18 acetylase RimI-like enzyme
LAKSLLSKRAAKGGHCNIVVRRATQSDVPSLIRNFQKVANEKIYLLTEKVSPEQKKGIRKRITDSSSLVLVAELVTAKKRYTVGELALARPGSSRKSRHVRNLSMSVINGFRGLGIGSALMDYATDWAKKTREVEKISLSVFSSNVKALNLYKRFGFEIEGIRKKAFILTDQKYVDEVEMGLFVKSPRKI